MTTHAHDELLPCPWCNAPSKIKRDLIFSNKWHAVCDASPQQHRMESHYLYEHLDNPQKLAIAWNTRPREAALTKQLEVALKLLEEAIFNAKSVISNMESVEGGYGFSTKDEKIFIKKARNAIEQIKGGV